MVIDEYLTDRFYHGKNSRHNCYQRHKERLCLSWHSGGGVGGRGGGGGGERGYDIRIPCIHNGMGAF